MKIECHLDAYDVTANDDFITRTKGAALPFHRLKCFGMCPHDQRLLTIDIVSVIVQKGGYLVRNLEVAIEPFGLLVCRSFGLGSIAFLAVLNCEGTDLSFVALAHTACAI